MSVNIKNIVNRVLTLITMMILFVVAIPSVYANPDGETIGKGSSKHLTMVRDTICPSQLPYTMGRVTFNSGGVIRDTLVGVDLTDSIVVYTLVVNPNTFARIGHVIWEYSLPYTFNGITYTLSSPWIRIDDRSAHIVDTIHISNVYGCDSTIFHDIEILWNVFDTVERTICANQLPYTWNEYVFTHAGTHSVTLYHAGQMLVDSTVTMTLNVNPTTTGDTIAMGCDSYEWYNNSYTISGNYPHTFVGANHYNCDSIVTLHLTINRNSYSLVRDTVIENNLINYVFNNTPLRDSVSDTIIIIPNATGCDSIINFSLFVHWNKETHLYDTICENSLSSYRWQDSTFNGSETKSIVYTAASGADSTVYMHLTVNLNTILIARHTVVENSLPYSFLYTQFGSDSQYDITTPSYSQVDTTLIIPNVNGCDSLVLYTLKVFWNIHDTLDSTICQNSLPFTWKGNTFSVADTQTVVLPSAGANSVDSILVLQLNVNHNTHAVYLDTCTENQLPRTYLGTDFSDSISNQQLIISNALGCDSIVDYSLFVHWNIATDEYDTICENQLPFIWKDSIFSAPSPTPTGAYTLVKSRLYQTIHHADSLVTMHLTVNRNTFQSLYDTIIENQLPYHWEDTLFAAGDTLSKTKIIPNANGCDSLITLNLFVWENKTTQADSLVCNKTLPLIWNDSIFTQTGQKSTTLHTIHGADSIVNMNVTVAMESWGTDSLAACGQYTWINGTTYTESCNTDSTIILNRFGCDSTVYLNLTINLSTIAEARFDTVCISGLPYIYEDTIFMEGTLSGQYNIFMTDTNGCDSIIPLNLYVMPLPVVAIEQVDFNCATWQYTLAASHTDAVDYITWSSTPGDTTLTGQENNDTIWVSPYQSTTYSATASVERFNCGNSQSITVQTGLPIEARISYNPPYATADQLELTFTDVSIGNIASRLWLTEDREYTERSFSYIYPISEDSIWVTLIVYEDQHQCNDTATVWIPYKTGLLWAPNAFTPDGDNNQRFVIVCHNVPEFEIYIYDRKGALVYHSTDPNEGWDGTYKGMPCIQNNYVYKVYYSTIDDPNTKHTLVGSVLLLR